MTESPTPALPDRRTAVLAAAAFAAIALLVHGQVFTHSFVLLDDTQLIYANPTVRGTNPSTLKAAFTTYDPELYVPLTMVSYQIDYMLGGKEPFQYHLTNLALHVADALLVALVLWLLLADGAAALFGGLLFLVHPINVEAVAWASARKDLLAAFFGLSTIVAYLRWRETGERRTYWLGAGAFLLALLSKVMVVTLPVALLLLDWLRGRRLDRAAILEKAPYFALSLVFGVVALFGKTETAPASTAIETILMAGRSAVFSLQTFLTPYGLSAIYPHDGPITLADGAFVGSWIVLLALAGLAIWSLRRGRHTAFALAFFTLMLAPSFLNFAKVGEFFITSDRYAYLALLGPLYVLCRYGPSFVENFTGSRRAPAVVAAAVLAGCGWLSYKQQATWHDTSTIFAQTLAHYPDAYVAHLNLAVYAREQGRLDDAERHLADAAEGHRDTADLHTVRASLLMRRGRLEEAAVECEAAIALEPEDAEAHFGLGLARLEQRRLEEAAQAFLRTLELVPAHLNAENSLAAIALERGDLAEAERRFRRAVELDPGFAFGWFNLGVTLERAGKREEALQAFRRVVRLQPNDAEAREKVRSLGG